MYRELWRHRDTPVTFDDLDGLGSDRNAVRLLKELTQTEPVKRIAWKSATKLLEEEGIPDEFTTTSKVCIIANEWGTRNRNVAALEDRGHVIVFQPAPEEVHRRTAAWFNDPEIYAFVGEHLRLVCSLSMRHYTRAAEMKENGQDWREALHELWKLPPELGLVAELGADASFASEQERERTFRERSSGATSRATYYRRKKLLRG